MRLSILHGRKFGVALSVASLTVFLVGSQFSYALTPQKICNYIIFRTITPVTMTCPSAPPTTKSVGAAPSALSYTKFDPTAQLGGCGTPSAKAICGPGTTRFSLLDNNGNLTSACGNLATSCPNGTIMTIQQDDQFTNYTCVSYKGDCG